MAIASQLRDLVDTFSELTAQHLRLLRAELAGDAKFIGLRLGVIAALTPLVLVGYAFLCVALAYGLMRVLAPGLSFLIVGLLNLGIGAVGIRFVIRQLQARPVLEQSMNEIDATSTLVRRNT